MARTNTFTTAQVAEALKETKGMTTLTARRLGCSYNTVRRYLDRSEELSALQKELTEQMGDAVELALYDEAVNKRNTAALIFLAKTKFKQRGYIERQEIEIDDWRSQAIRDIQAGKIDYDALMGAFDSDIATQLFREAGIPVSSGESTTRDSKRAQK